MIYGYEQPIQLPTLDLYDKSIMAMALNAVKDMYDRGYQEMKDFQKTYGDFMTPIGADQDWWIQNVNNPVRDAVNALYAQGIDPLRNPQGRAMVSQLISGMPYGMMNKMKQSAENAKIFQRARAELEMKGLYNPLMAKYDGPNLSTYSTADSGVWDKMSPTPFENVATFSNPYFEGMKPNIHKESKNGIDYDVEQITNEDLKAIADAHHNELVSTPQGQMMYKYYQDVARANGSTDVDKDAREMFNAAIADSQHRRIYRIDDYKDNFFKSKELENARETLALRQRQLELQKQRNDILANKGTRSNSSSSGSGSSSNKELVSYYEPLYQNLVINTLNKDPLRSTTFSNKEFIPDMGNSILSAQRNIANEYFGVSDKADIYGASSIKSPVRIGIDYTKGNVTGFAIPGGANLNTTVDPNISNTKEFQKQFNNNYKSYLDQFSIGDYSGGFSSMFAKSWKQGSAKIDDLTFAGKSVDKIKGQNYVAFGLSDVNSIYSAKELSARMAGITGPVLEDAIKETQRLRERLKGKIKSDNGSVAMKATSPIGAGLGDVGQYGVYSNVEFRATDGTEITLFGDCVIATPFMSTPNPNAMKDDRLNLDFDQTMDLERNLMDNSATRSLGVSSNTGSIDNTLPTGDPWYLLNDDFSDFDWDY